jgi:hypothetical protein
MEMWYLYIAIKKNEIFSFAGKWMELENIILNEVIQVQKDKGHVFSLCSCLFSLKLSQWLSACFP